MSAPGVIVLLGFGANATHPFLFVLNQSVLDSTTDRLAADTVMVNVSDSLSGQITVNRGRSREVDAFQAGTATFTLRNEDRRFDPTNTASPYYPGIVPRAAVRILLTTGRLQSIFTGYVEDYSVAYIKPNVCEVTVTCSDGFVLLANAKLDTASFAQELSGTRVTNVLNRAEVQFPATTSIDAGLMTMQASTQDNVDALSYLQTVAWSEAGLLFIDRNGTLTFQDHNFVAQQIAALPNGQETFTDTGVSYNGELYGFTDISLESAVTLLYNRVEGSRAGGVKQSAADAASQSSYRVRTLSLPSLENVSDADVLSICQFLLGRYSKPEVRFDALTVELSGLSLEQQNQLAITDIGTVVIAERTPPGGGSPATIKQLSLVERMAWSMDVSSSHYSLTLGLGNISGQAGFVLDSASFGIVSTNTIGL